MEKSVESKNTVQTYLDRLKYALDNGAQIQVQIDRQVDSERKEQYTTKFTISDLFPNEDLVAAIKRELGSLSVGNYIQTVPDTRFPNKPPMYEFGKVYPDTKEVYIKIRVAVVENSIFVMSFHYPMHPFTQATFPYED